MRRLQKSVESFLNNQYVSAVLTLFVILYASLARPMLPSAVANLFSNPLFRVVFLALLAWTATHNAQVSLLVAIGFLVTMNLLGEQNMLNGLFGRRQEDM